MASEPLPNEKQRRQICELMHWAFVELRRLDGDQAHDLADAFHNLPQERYGKGKWSVSRTRAFLQRYHDKHQGHGTYNYVAAFDKIFPTS